MELRELELGLTEDRPLTCAIKEPMLWTAPIKSPQFKATCHLSAARFAARHLVTLAICMYMSKCTLGKNLIAVAYVGSAAVPLGGCRSTSVATQEKNLSAVRFVGRVSLRWLT